jgi:diguanylate cyclase (GGDEF)-like protein
LESVVRTVASVLGRKGKLFRYGGDEFVTILPDFDIKEAEATAERIRFEVEQSRLGDDIAVTASIGLCTSDKVTVKSSEEMLSCADKAMYASKRAGKNKVTSWMVEIPKM